MRYQNIFSALNGNAWPITETGMRTVWSLMERAEAGELDSVITKALLVEDGELLTANLIKRGKIGIVMMDGFIFPRAHLFVKLCGAVSAQMLSKNIKLALDDPSINAVVLVSDSPGGSITGISATSDFIYQNRKEKPIIAFGEGLVASAAYWIASACEEVVVDQTAECGSIGVIATVVSQDTTGKNSYTFLSSVSPRKRPRPDEKEGAQQIQDTVDMYGHIFVENVARNRGVPKETVLNDFGRGGTFVGKEAVAAGLADRVGSLEELIEQYSKGVFMTVNNTAAKGEETPVSATQKIITVAALQESYPQLSAQIANDAVVAERDRVQRLLKVSAKAGLAHDDETLLAAITDGKSSGDFSEALIEQGKVAMGSKTAPPATSNPMLDAIYADASPEVRAVPAQTEQQTTAAAEKSYMDAFLSGANEEVKGGAAA